MAIEVYTLLNILAIIFQFVAVYISYKIYTFNRLSKWWLALVFAFFVQGIRRVVTYLSDADYVNLGNTVLLDHILMFTISLFILVGLWSMRNRFESFEIIERKTESKVNNMFKKSK